MVHSDKWSQGRWENAVEVVEAGVPPAQRAQGSWGRIRLAVGLRVKRSKNAMPLTIRSVEYYYANVRDELGAAYRVLSQLAERGVNLLAFTAGPSGPGLAQFAAVLA